MVLESDDDAADDDDDETRSCYYDYVVIGSGPSCAGLIGGLLLQLEEEQDEDDGPAAPTTTRAPPRPNHLTRRRKIVIVERGPLVIEDDDDDDGGGEGTAVVTTKSTPSPVSRWFRSSHDPLHDHTTIPRGTMDVATLSSSSMATSPTTVPCGYFQRIVDVPMGRGWGGTSLINACLCQMPIAQDFEHWPEPYPSKMMEACELIQKQLERNGCLYRWKKKVKEEDNGNGNGNDNDSDVSGCFSTPVHLTVRRQEEASRSPSPSSSSPPPPPPPSWDTDEEYRRCTYWDGLLGSRSPTPIADTPERTGLWHAFRRHVVVVRGQAERLLFQDDKNKEGGAGSDTINRSRRRVVGVEVSVVNVGRGGGERGVTYRTLHATKDVIVCAGALETPALLLVSGIGSSPESDNAEEGCENTSLPVGMGLRDHVGLSRAMWASQRTTSSEPTVNGVAALRTLRVGRSIFQIGVMEGPDYASILPVVVSGWFRIQIKSRRPHHSASLRNLIVTTLACILSIVRVLIKIVLKMLLMEHSPITRLLRSRVVTVSVFLMNPTSTGRVAIRHKPKNRSLVTTEAPPTPLRRSDVELDIHLGYLETTEDVDAMRTGWFVSESHLANMGAAGIELFPGFAIRKWPRLFESKHTPVLPDEARFGWFAKITCLPYFHWSGSCRMTTADPSGKDDAHGVVGPDLKVHGYDGLRICDASVFPTSVSAPTALTCAALGYVFGTHVLNVGDTSRRPTFGT